MAMVQDYSHGMFRPGGVFGDDTLPPQAADSTETTIAKMYSNPITRILVMASVAVSAYHGYKRNNSIGWAIGWGLLGGLFPLIVPAIAFAQGIDKPLRATPNKHRRRRRLVSARTKKRPKKIWRDLAKWSHKQRKH